MSHFTEVKTEIKDLARLTEALRDVGVNFEVDEAGLSVVNFFGDEHACPVRIDTGTKYAVGLRQSEDGSYEFVADWELLDACKIDTADLRARITQRYAYRVVKTKLEAEGYTFGEEVVDERGNLQMVVSTW